MATIAVDIDDTLYPFCDLARKIALEEGIRRDDKQLIAAAYAPWPEWRSPPDLMGLDKWLEIIALCHDNDMILNQRPYDGAVEVLTELAQHHDLLYISNRATETKMATRFWLDTNYFPRGELVVTDQAKKPFVAHCQYLIDDRPKTIIEFIHDYDWYADNRGTSVGERRAFSLTKEFNRGLTDVSRVYLAPTWYGMRHYMAGKGLLPEVAGVV